MRHLKLDVLTFLSDGRPRWTFQVCDAVGYRERRSMASYLRRLERQDLIRGFTNEDSYALRFQITEKGRARLRFFQRNPNYFRKRGKRTW